MTTAIDGTLGVNRVQDGSVVQADLAANVALTGALFVASQSSAQTMPTNSYASMVADVVEVNLLGAYNATTGVFQPTVAGYYQFNLGTALGVAGQACDVAFVKNNSIVMASNNTDGSPFGSNVTTSMLLYMNGTTDYVGVVGKALSADQSMSIQRFSGFLVRAA